MGIKGLARIVEFITRHHHTPLHGNLAAFQRGEDLASSRGAARRDFLRVGGQIDEFEFKLCRFAQQALQAFGVLQAGNLHQDAICTLTHNCDFLRPFRVDALGNHVARGFQRAINFIINAGFGRAHDDPCRITHGNVPVTRATNADAVRLLPGEFDGLIQLRGIPRNEGQFPIRR